jgi:imidazolonepropionase
VAETYLLRGARQLLTLRGPSGVRRGSALAELSIIPDGALLIREGRIVEIGVSRRVENLAAARHARIIDATGKVVMPAFVDSGITLIYAHDSTEQNDQRLREGVACTARGQREDLWEGARALKLYTKRGLSLRSSRLAASLLRHGTATAGVISGYGLDESGEVKTLKAIELLKGVGPELVPVFFGANIVPDGTTAEEYSRSVLVPSVKVVAHRKLSNIAAVRCGPGAFDFHSAHPYLQAARECGMRGALFAQQFERDESVSLALDVDALSIAHLEHASAVDIEQLAASDTVAVLTPAATYHMGLTRFAPARQLIESGAAVALATAHNPDHSPSYSMPFNISLACRYLGMSVAEAVVASTINAAHSLGYGHQTGSIEIGRNADLLILNARDYRELAFMPGVDLLHTVIKGGSGFAVHHGAEAVDPEDVQLSRDSRPTN